MSTKKPEKGHKAKLPGHDEDSREERSTKRHVYIEPGVKIDLVESLRKQQEIAQNESTCHQQKQLFWTKVASALLFITAGLAAWQGYSTKLSADAARNIVERGNSRAIKCCTAKTLLIRSPYPGQLRGTRRATKHALLALVLPSHPPASNVAGLRNEDGRQSVHES
jgi:hypothetical protein